MNEKNRPVSEELERYLVAKQTVMKEAVAGILFGHPPYSNYSLEGNWTQKTDVVAAVGVFVTEEGTQAGLFDFSEGETEDIEFWDKISKLSLTDRVRGVELNNYQKNQDRQRLDANEKYLKPQCQNEGIPLALLVFGTREDGDSAVYLFAPPNLKPSEALELIREEAKGRLVNLS